MDPASAIGIASSVITFADLTYKFIAAVKKIHDTTSNQLLESQTRETMIERMDNLASKMVFNKPLVDQHEEEKAINQIAWECRRISGEITTHLRKIEPKKDSKGNYSLKESIKGAAKGMWTEKYLNNLQLSLDACMTQLLRQKMILERYVEFLYQNLSLANMRSGKTKIQKKITLIWR
jgi:hypothetical protein